MSIPPWEASVCTHRKGLVGLLWWLHHEYICSHVSGNLASFFFCIQNKTGLSLVRTNQLCRYSCDEAVGTLCQNVCNEVIISWHFSGMFVLVCGVRAEDSSGTSSYSSENDIFTKKKRKKPWNSEAPLRVWFKRAVFLVQVNNWLWLSLVPWLRLFARERFLVNLVSFLWEQVSPHLKKKCNPDKCVKGLKLHTERHKWGEVDGKLLTDLTY